MHWNDGSIVLSLPELTWQEWTMIGVAFNFIYGFITHITSIPSIRRWNKKDGYEHISDVVLFFALLYRLFFNLPFRVMALVLGVFKVIVMMPATGRLVAGNSLLAYGWRWRFKPSQVYDVNKFFSDFPHHI